MIITQIFDVKFCRTRKIKIFDIFFATYKINELLNVYSVKNIFENEW